MSMPVRTPEHNPITRLADTQKHSLRAHIDAMCAYCMGCTAEGINPGFRSEIRACSAPNCPLYKVRPHQRKSSSNVCRAGTD